MYGEIKGEGGDFCHLQSKQGVCEVSLSLDGQISHTLSSPTIIKSDVIRQVCIMGQETQNHHLH